MYSVMEKRVVLKVWEWKINVCIEKNSFEATWTELVMVLRAKIVAQSFTVDWESNAPCVSIKSTATYSKKKMTTNMIQVSVCLNGFFVHIMQQARIPHN